MKKIIVAVFLAVALVSPALSHAQTVNIDVSQLSPEQIQALINQLEQLVALYEQLLALQQGTATSTIATITPATSNISAQTSTTSIVVTNTPITDQNDLNLGGQIDATSTPPAPPALIVKKHVAFARPPTNGGRAIS